MKSASRIFLKRAGLTFVLLVPVVFVFAYISSPRLPQETEKIIEEVMNSEVPEFLSGQSGYVNSGGYKIWYESLMPKGAPKGTILLFQGMCLDVLGWPPSFLKEFTDAGYRIVRFDYRGTGVSDWVKDWLVHPYTVADLAADAEAVLDQLQIEKVHLVGLSMGAMVAQAFALNYPERIDTLTSLMSSGNIFDDELPQPYSMIIFEFAKVGTKYLTIPTVENTIKMVLGVRMVLRGDAEYEIDLKTTAQLVRYKLLYRNGFNPEAVAQHGQAMRRYDFDYEKLKTIKVPVLIIHGENDPFVPIEHSQKLATVITHAKTHWIPNMGHDLPEHVIEPITKDIIAHIER